MLPLGLPSSSFRNLGICLCATELDTEHGWEFVVPQSLRLLKPLENSGQFAIEMSPVTHGLVSVVIIER